MNNDRSLIVSFLRAHLTNESDEQRFRWLYLSNPAGPACALIGTDHRLGTTVGVAAAFPRVIRVGSELVTGWVFGDFCVAPEYRSGGPALVLQRSLIEEAGRRGAALFYDFPSSAMLAIYRRLGVTQFGQMTRLIRLVRADPIVRRIVKPPAIARAIAFLLDPLLGLMASASGAPASMSIELHPGLFDDQFSDMDQRAGRPFGARIARTAEYLNWRFREQPRRSYTVLTGRRQGTLVGFSVTHLNGDVATIIDISAVDEESVAGLLRSTVAYLRRSTPTKSVHFPVLADSLLSALVLRDGFRARESAPVVLSAASTEALAVELLDPRGWSLTSGDRDS